MNRCGRIGMRHWRDIRIIIYIVCGTIGAMWINHSFSTRRSHGAGHLVIRAQNDMRAIAAAIHQYEMDYGRFPKGTNAAIFRALMASDKNAAETNPKLISYLNVHRTNTAGEMLDPWGTSYRILNLHTNRVVIRSAGANAAFNDADDIVARKSARD